MIKISALASKPISQKGIVHIVSLLACMLIIGIVGTYLIVSGHAMSPEHTNNYHAPAGSRERIVKIARQQLGYAERPVNKVKYFQWAGDTPRSPGPWCSVFATWVWHAAGVDLHGQPYPMQPSVSDVRDLGKREGRFKANTARPEPGDAVLYGFDGGGPHSHIGIVERVKGSRLYVIEGNAGQGNHSDKYVIRRIINLSRLNDSSYASRHIPWQHLYGYVAPPSRQ